MSNTNGLSAFHPLDSTSLEAANGGFDDYGDYSDGFDDFPQDTYQQDTYQDSYQQDAYQQDATQQDDFQQDAYQDAYQQDATQQDDFQQDTGDQGDRTMTADGSTGTQPPTPQQTGQTNQRFDDGTELQTTTYDNGITVSRSRETETQTFDDGSRLITTRDTYGSGTQYTDTRSMDSLESRLQERPLIDDPRTATPDDVQLARDVLDNYDYRLLPEERATLNDYINNYYTGGSSPIYGDSPPTPTNSPTIDERGSGVG